MITDIYKITPRYSETDQMGYIYHGNYAGYCHQARTELMRKMNLEDKVFENHGVILPVIELNIRYIKPSFYDEEITIKTELIELPKTRMKFNFEIYNATNEKITQCYSEVVFVDDKTRKPIRIPNFANEIMKKAFENIL